MRRFSSARALALPLLLVAAAAWFAPAAPAAPAWRIDAISNTTAAPGATLTYVMQITNVGDAGIDATATPIDLSGTLPEGLTILRGPASGWDCSTLVVGAQQFTCQNTTAVLPPSGYRSFTVDVAVASDAAGVARSSFTVVGGDASNPSATTFDPTTITATPPPFGIDAFDGTVSADAAGTPFTQAAGHPFGATVAIDFNTITNPAPLKGRLWPVEPVKDIYADLPPGLVGDPTGTERCTASQLASDGIVVRAMCPPASQVGTVVVRLNGLGVGVGGPRTVFGPLPVYNLVPGPGVPARFGFNVAGTVITLDAELRSATDYGLSVRVRNIPQALAIAGTSLTFWGVPADDVHTPERACAGQLAPWEGGPTCATGGARRAFLRNPTSCTAPGVGLPVSLRMDSWERPGVFTDATFVSHLQPGYPLPPDEWGPEQGATGCDAVPFDPGLSVVPGAASAGAPSGFRFDVSLPQSEDPDAIGQSDLRRAVVRLPLGVRVNPSAADGLAGCSPAQVGLSSVDDASCPDGSRVGSLTIVTPLLDEPLTGSIYLAGPHDNPFDTLLAVYLVARGPGLIVKLAGRVEADPLTGQVTAVFDDVPQLPFSSVRIAFDAGPRAPLVNPPVCGAYAASAELTSWSGRTVVVESGFSPALDAAGAPCPSPPGAPAASTGRFAPGFSAGVESPAAGRSSPFHLRLTRTDADEELGGVSVTLPPGLLGHLADVDLCPEAAAVAGTCTERSRVGSLTVGAGAGPLPFFLGGGRVYVTGPYRGAPFGLSIVVPAVAGPFDLGVVVVRAAILVDRTTAVLSVVTDPLPRILQGIPLQLRDVRVAVDRPGFMLNPTSCAEKRVVGNVTSTAGRTAVAADRFQAAECRDLPFHPTLRIFVGARGRTRAGVSTPLTAVLRQAPGQANIRSVGVTLPKTINARLGVVANACTPDAFHAGNCEKARVGTAVAITPLLRDPLRGGAYLVRSRPRGLPDLIIALRGQVDFDLVGTVSVPGGKLLRATFASVPDVPITSFVLRLTAGRRGVVGTAANLCAQKNAVAPTSTSLFGQNGLRHQLELQRLRVHACT